MPTGSLAIMIKRNKETIIPKGDTRILAGDNKDTKRKAITTLFYIIFI